MYSSLRRQALYELDEIITGKSFKKEIDQINSYMLSLLKPTIFSGPRGFEIIHEKKYVEVCAILREHANYSDVRQLSTLEFYTALEHVKTKLKNQSNHGTKANQV